MERGKRTTSAWRQGLLCKILCGRRDLLEWTVATVLGLRRGALENMPMLRLQAWCARKGLLCFSAACQTKSSTMSFGSGRIKKREGGGEVWPYRKSGPQSQSKLFQDPLLQQLRRASLAEGPRRGGEREQGRRRVRERCRGALHQGKPRQARGPKRGTWDARQPPLDAGSNYVRPRSLRWEAIRATKKLDPYGQTVACDWTSARKAELDRRDEGICKLWEEAGAAPKDCVVN